MFKDIEYYMSLPYTIEFQNDPEYGWHANVKELPGCMNQGDTPEEALEAILDAMRGWIEIALNKGNPIPEPRLEGDYSGKFNVRVPKSLHHKLVDEARKEGVSLNQYINVALAGAAAGNLLEANEPHIEEDKKEINWPGLSRAAKAALRMAGREEEASEYDERLFSSWLGENMMQINSSIRLNNFPEANKYLEYMIVILRQMMNLSPIFENLVAVFENQRSMLRLLGELRGLPVEETLQPMMNEYINNVNRPIKKQKPAPLETEQFQFDELVKFIKSRE